MQQTVAIWRRLSSPGLLELLAVASVHLLFLDNRRKLIHYRLSMAESDSEHFNVIDYKKPDKRIIISGTDEAEKEAGKGLQFGAKASVSVVATIEGKQKARSSCMRSHEGKVGGSETGRRQKDEDDEAQSEED